MCRQTYKTHTKAATSELVSVKWCEILKEWFITDLMVPMGIEQCNQQLKEIHLYTFFYVLLSLIIVKVFITLAFHTKPSKTNGKIWLSFLPLVFYLSIIFV